MESSTIFPILVSVIFSIWSAYKLYTYAIIGTKKRVLFVTYLGFIVSFTCVILIPFDIDSTLANQYRGFLFYAWRVMYWSLQILGWIVYPFNMEKERTGSWEKSLRRNSYWWILYVIIGLVAVVYFFGVTNFGFKGLLAFTYALSNTWGLSLIILLAGYGLVAAPKWFYLQSNPKEYIDYLYLKAVALEDSRLAAMYDLLDAYNGARKTMDQGEPELVAVSTFIADSYGVSSSTKKPSESAKDTVVDSDKAVALRDALQTARRSFCSWKLLVEECILYENVYNVEDSTINRHLAMIHRASSWGLKFLSILGGILSILIIIGQSTIFINVWWLSVLAIWFRKGIWENPSSMDGGFSSFIIQALLTIPLLWIYYCCIWALTRIKLAKFYGLYPMHNTDTISLMWCGGMLIRIAFPLVYNYLYVLRVPDHPATVFEEMQGWMDVVPLLGGTVVIYLPLLMLVMAILTLTNTYSKMITCLGLRSLQFETPSDPNSRAKLIDQGKGLIKRERAQRRGSSDSSIELGSTVLGYSQLGDNDEQKQQQQEQLSRILIK